MSPFYSEEHEVQGTTEIANLGLGLKKHPLGSEMD